MRSPNQAASSKPVEPSLALTSPENNPKTMESMEKGPTTLNSKASLSSFDKHEAQPIRVLIDEEKIRGFGFTWSQVSGALAFASQIVNFIAVLVFGLWSVRSYNAALRANQISHLSLQAAQNANQLALYTFCMSQTNNDVGTCGPVVNDLSLRSLASLVVPSFTASSVSSSVSVPASSTSIAFTSSSTTIHLATTSTSGHNATSSSTLVTSTTMAATSRSEATAGTVPSAPAMPGSTRGHHGPGLSLGAEIGAIVGGVLGFTAIMASVASFWRAKYPQVRSQVRVERA